MLSLLTAKEVRPESEALDRDPGIISLIAAVARFTGRRVGAGARLVDRGADQAEVHDPSAVWSNRNGSR